MISRRLHLALPFCDGTSWSGPFLPLGYTRQAPNCGVLYLSRVFSGYIDARLASRIGADAAESKSCFASTILRGWNDYQYFPVLGATYFCPAVGTLPEPLICELS